MSTASGTVPTEAAVRAAVAEAWRAGAGRPTPTEDVLVLSARPEWTGATELHVDADVVRVVACPTTLAVRDALAQREPGSRLVLLTDLDAAALGVDVLAAAVSHKPRRVEVWDAVRHVFGVAGAQTDASLVRTGPDVAAALVDLAPAGGWRRPRSGVLTKDHALSELVAGLLDTAPDRLDTAGVLQALRAPVAALRWSELPTRLRRDLDGWLVRRGGAALVPVLALAARGEGTSAIANGLAAGALQASGTHAERAVADERWFGKRLDDDHRRQWASACQGWVQRRLGGDDTPDDAFAELDAADEVLVGLGSGAGVDSAVLPSGYQARLHRLAGLLRRAVADGSVRSLAEAEKAFTAVTDHGMAAHRRASTETANAALRLLRWAGTNPSLPGSLQEALSWQLRVGAWVDRCRQAAWNGSYDAVLGDAVADVLGRVEPLRRSVDQAAAALVRREGTNLPLGGGVRGVEDVLSTVVRPLVAQGPVLLLVLDGMSASAATSLVAEATGPWTEVVAGDGDGRAAVLSGLPSLTTASRASLLCGTVTSGDQDREKRGLQTAIDAARLYHLADLPGAAGHDLAAGVRTAVQDTDQRLVAVVLNTIDDALDSGEPGRAAWGVQDVRHLDRLLTVARSAGRVVVLSSDHGHVVDRRDESRRVRHPGARAARWRPGDGPVEEGEVALTGPRVQAEGHAVVVPWDENLRYGNRREGYHGGASLAEVAVPVVVLVPRGAAVPSGWAEADEQEPAWWSEPVRYDVTADAGGEGTLFGDPGSRTR